MAGGNAIASGSVVLTANADGLKTGLQKASGDIDSWGKSVSAKAGGGGGAGGAGGGLLGNLMGGAGAVGKLGPAGLAIGAVGAAAGVAAIGLKAASDTLGDISKQGAMAAALGMTAEQFTGIAGVANAAGEDTKEFVESLVTLGKLGANAAAGTEEASKAFSSLGLNAQEFIKLRPDEQFHKVFEALNKVTDGGERTRLMMAAFGEDGGKLLLPLLQKTPEQLRKMSEGFAITGEEMKKATAASEAVKSMEGNISKLWRGLAVSAAPFIEGLANAAGKVMDFFQPAFDWLGRAFSTYGELASRNLGAVLDALGSAAEWVSATVQDLFGSLGELPTVQQAITTAFKYVGLAGAYAWDIIKVGVGAVAEAMGFLLEKALAPVITGFKGVVGLSASLPDAIRPDWLDKFNASLANVDASVAGIGVKMQNWGAGTRANFGKSAAEFEKWFANGAAKAGEKVADEIKRNVDEGLKNSGPVKLAGALAQGSKEAYSMVLKNQLRSLSGGGEDPAKAAVKEAKKGNELRKKGNDALDKIKDHLEKIKEV